MAKTALSTIKSWFETGDFPTAAQFANAWDSFWHKDDLIPMANIDGLDDALEQAGSQGQSTTRQLLLAKQQVGTNWAFGMAANSILLSIDIVFVSGTPVVKAGRTAGASDIMGNRTVTNAKTSNNTVNEGFVASGNVNITVTGGVVLVVLNYENNYYTIT